MKNFTDNKNMQINNISSSFNLICPIDSEEKEIMRRLLAYGIQPTGNKSTDYAMLHQIEKQKAKSENVASNKFYTVSSSEMQKMIEMKKGASILGDYNKMMINFKK